MERMRARRESIACSSWGLNGNLRGGDVDVGVGVVGPQRQVDGGGVGMRVYVWGAGVVAAGGDGGGGGYVVVVVSCSILISVDVWTGTYFEVVSCLTGGVYVLSALRGTYKVVVLV